MSNRLELDRIQAQSRADRGGDSGDRAADRASSRTRCRCCSAGRPAPIARERLADRRSAAAADSARPAGLAARAAARRRAGGAASRRGQRRHRRRQGAVLSDDQPDRLSRRRQRRSHDVPRRRRRASGRWAPACFSRSSRRAGIRRNLEATQARFDEALAEYQKAALNGYREVANCAGHDPEAGRGAGPARSSASPRCRTRPTWPASRYDSGLASYIEILTADQQLFQQQLLLAQTRGAELRARAELYRALGGGWQP